MKTQQMKRQFWICLSLFAAAAAFILIKDCLKPKFQDLTVECGTEYLTIDDFKTEYAWSSNADFVSDVTTVDLGKVGETELVLCHIFRKETVTLRVTDTTPPQADVDAVRSTPVTGFPDASELVHNIRDMSDVTVFYKEDPRIPLDYADLPVTVVLEDSYGNRTEKICVFSFRWMPETVTVELGEEITEDLVLYNPTRDSFSLDPVAFNAVRSDGIGNYTIQTTISGQTQQCVLTVQDTKGPDLTLRNVRRAYGSYVSMNHFIENADDPSGIAEIRLLTELGRKPRGVYSVVIEAEDTVGNVTRKEAKFYVASEYTAPKIIGEMTPITLKKGEALPDMLEGIYATDNNDETVTVECDTSEVDLSVGGIYYAVYRAVDSSGNETTKKREITIIHDEEDTKNIVREIASKLENADAAEIRNYVCNNIYYNSDWGGDDPVWHGFTEKRGNCYVHALCMKALLDIKGIPNQLIWTTEKTHYWLIVKVDNKWVHMDPTPFVRRLPLYMNDLQRRSTLSGRTWDMTQWPKCE